MNVSWIRLIFLGLFFIVGIIIPLIFFRPVKSYMLNEFNQKIPESEFTLNPKIAQKVWWTIFIVHVLYLYLLFAIIEPQQSFNDNIIWGIVGTYGFGLGIIFFDIFFTIVFFAIDKRHNKNFIGTYDKKERKLKLVEKDTFKIGSKNFFAQRSTIRGLNNILNKQVTQVKIEENNEVKHKIEFRNKKGELFEGELILADTIELVKLEKSEMKDPEGKVIGNGYQEVIKKYQTDEASVILTIVSTTKKKELDTAFSLIEKNKQLNTENEMYHKRLIEQGENLEKLKRDAFMEFYDTRKSIGTDIDVKRVQERAKESEKHGKKKGESHNE